MSNKLLKYYSKLQNTSQNDSKYNYYLRKIQYYLEGGGCEPILNRKNYTVQDDCITPYTIGTKQYNLSLNDVVDCGNYNKIIGKIIEKIKAIPDIHFKEYIIHCIIANLYVKGDIVSQLDKFNFGTNVNLVTANCNKTAFINTAFKRIIIMLYEKYFNLGVLTTDKDEKKEICKYLIIRFVELFKINLETRSNYSRTISLSFLLHELYKLHTNRKTSKLDNIKNSSLYFDIIKNIFSIEERNINSPIRNVTKDFIASFDEILIDENNFKTLRELANEGPSVYNVLASRTPTDTYIDPSLSRQDPYMEVRPRSPQYLDVTLNPTLYTDPFVQPPSPTLLHQGSTRSRSGSVRRDSTRSPPGSVRQGSTLPREAEDPYMVLNPEDPYLTIFTSKYDVGSTYKPSIGSNILIKDFNPVNKQYTIQIGNQPIQENIEETALDKLVKIE